MNLVTLTALFVSLTGLLAALALVVAMTWGARQSPAVRKYLVEVVRAFRSGR